MGAELPVTEFVPDFLPTFSACLSPGLIHARYIVTSHGLNAMLAKYRGGEFGRCPRMLCNGQRVVPLGISGEPEHEGVKIYCPKCGEVYAPIESATDLVGFG